MDASSRLESSVLEERIAQRSFGIFQGIGIRDLIQITSGLKFSKPSEPPESQPKPPPKSPNTSDAPGPISDSDNPAGVTVRFVQGNQ